MTFFSLSFFRTAAQYVAEARRGFTSRYLHPREVSPHVALDTDKARAFMCVHAKVYGLSFEQEHLLPNAPNPLLSFPPSLSRLHFALPLAHSSYTFLVTLTARINREGKNSGMISSALTLPNFFFFLPPRKGEPPSLEEYEPLRTIGTGSFGRVLLVRHTPTGQPQALKILEKERVVQLKQGRFCQRTNSRWLGVGRTRLLLSPFASVSVPITLLFLLSGLPSLSCLAICSAAVLMRSSVCSPSALHILLSLSS